MKTKKYYFYLDNEVIKTSKTGWAESFFEVIAVNTFNDNVDEAERKARTIAQELGLPLAGGYFAEGCEPYNLKSHYTVINCPDNTKIQPYNDKDKFIIDLIEAESGQTSLTL